MPPRDAPSKGVCPPAVHRWGSHLAARETAARLSALLSSRRRAERKTLWNLYKRPSGGFGQRGPTYPRTLTATWPSASNPGYSPTALSALLLLVRRSADIR